MNPPLRQFWQLAKRAACSAVLYDLRPEAPQRRWHFQVMTTPSEVNRYR
jgi:hypothetical protein